MAYGTYGNLLTAIREVLDANGGSIRKITASRFTDDLLEALPEEEAQRRGIRADKPFRARITGQRRHPASPPVNGSVHLLALDVEVTVSRTIATAEKVSADQFATLEALGWEDADAVRQALCTPPNLQTTAAAAVTNLVGDALVYVDSRGRLVPLQTDGAQRYETIHRFTGCLKVSPAII